jgi:deazaflavin-dependent oxidoreductase (nitroreductase family)
MFGQLIVVVGALVLGIAALGAIEFVGVRGRVPLAVDLLRRFSRLFNPIQMRTAGTPGAYASVIRHVGRSSGRAYATPVGAVPTEDGFVIALPYGTKSNWVRNVLASGSATLVNEGGEYRVDQPELVPLETVATRFSPADQRSHRMFRVEHCLRLRRVDAAGQTEAA